MRQVSKKQSRINSRLSRIKKDLPKRCYLCTRQGNDLMHILPRSLFSEYICEDWNLTIGCREHHNLFDGDREFRSAQKELYEQVIDNVKEEDRGRVKRYFGRI